jgi:hypothetical protein
VLLSVTLVIFTMIPRLLALSPTLKSVSTVDGAVSSASAVSASGAASAVTVTVTIGAGLASLSRLLAMMTPLPMIVAMTVMAAPMMIALVWFLPGGGGGPYAGMGGGVVSVFMVPPGLALLRAESFRFGRLCGSSVIELCPDG